MATQSPRMPGRSGLLAGPAVGVVIAGVLILMFGAGLRRGTEDTDLFHRYAAAIRSGQVPYRDFRVEYPPLAVPLFLIPAGFATDLPTYKVAFAVEMLAAVGLGASLVGWWADRRGGRRGLILGLIWFAAYCLVLGRLIVTKYDAAPMLVGFAAAIGLARGRPALGGALAAVGGLLKVYPAVVAIVAGCRAVRHRDGRALVAGSVFIVVAAVGGLVWVVLGGVAGVGDSIRYQGDRGFEYGSLASGAQMLAARVVGASITIRRDHASFSVATPWSARILPAVFPAQVALVLAVGWVRAGRKRDDIVRSSGAAILAFIAAGKVGSPQFLIWLIPFAATLDGPIARRGRWLFLAVCVATLAAQGMLTPTTRTSLLAILAYNGRNVLVVALLGLWAFGPESGADDRAEPGPAAPEEPAP